MSHELTDTLPAMGSKMRSPFLLDLPSRFPHGASKRPSRELSRVDGQGDSAAGYFFICQSITPYEMTASGHSVPKRLSFVIRVCRWRRLPFFGILGGLYLKSCKLLPDRKLRIGKDALLP